MPEVSFTGAVEFNGSILRPPGKEVVFYMLPTHLSALANKCFILYVIINVFFISVSSTAIVNMEVLDQPCSPRQCERDHERCETWLFNADIFFKGAF